MKRFVILAAALVIAVSLTSADVVASPKIKKKHTKPGKDGAKITCSYCHKKAKIPKKKGGISARKGNEYCVACHK